MTMLTSPADLRADSAELLPGHPRRPAIPDAPLPMPEQDVAPAALAAIHWPRLPMERT